MPERLDIVVFGATGFTGKFTLPYVYKFTKSEGRILSWGIAGRSEDKLKRVLNETAESIGVSDLNSVPIIIADVEDEESIKNMTARARVIINCCGPYQLYGEVVVRACIETGTHHVDVSGEPLFIEGMELKYRNAAEKKGVYLVSACGAESVPADLGTIFLEKHFEGTLNSVEVYVRGYEEGAHKPGPKAHYGTWASAINAIGNYWSLLSLRRQLYPNSLPSFKPKLPLKFLPHRMNNKWALPFPATDYDVLKRSQRYFYENDKKRPIHVQCYILFESFIYVLLVLFLGFIILLLAQFGYGRSLLLKYPNIFTWGFISHEDPAVESLERTHLSFTLCGKGWNEKNVNNGTPINKIAFARVDVSNPGYGFTCYSLVLCALMILNESNRLPPKGGVYTPAVAFSKTSLIEELQKNGAVFEILTKKEE